MRISVFTGLIIVLAVFVSCKNSPAPKPRAFFRIDLPEKNYQNYESDFPFSFKYPVYSEIEEVNHDSAWINIRFRKLNARIYLSYQKLENDLNLHIEQSRKLSYYHTKRAMAIDESVIRHKENSVFGLKYSIAGNVASSTQFYLTDSLNHFLRGSLYFNDVPNEDSIAPVLKFINSDIDTLIQSLKWKE